MKLAVIDGHIEIDDDKTEKLLNSQNNQLYSISSRKGFIFFVIAPNPLVAYERTRQAVENQFDYDVLDPYNADDIEINTDGIAYMTTSNGSRVSQYIKTSK